MPSLAVRAWAKVNLTLRLIGRRADGYHLLQSLVVRVALGDVLTLSESTEDDLDLRITGPFAAGLPSGPANLVSQAARALRDRYGQGRGAAISLDKQLPHAAGLGGGSADAAATLVGLNRLWDLGLAPDVLHALAEPLGADVPVCLHDGPQVMEGIGERLRAFAGLPAFAILLVNPGLALATGPVFAARDAPFSGPLDHETAPRDRAGFLAWLAKERNDLQQPAIGLCPAIGSVLSTIAACDGCRLARMSGSGASCFGLFDDTSQAEAAARMIAPKQPGWWLAAAPVIAD